MMPAPEGNDAPGAGRRSPLVRACAVGLAMIGGLLAMVRPASAAEVVFATDGSAAAITEALTALGGGGVVFVPPGEWAWDQADQVIVTADGVTLLGAGPGHTLLYRRTSVDGGAFFQARGVRDLRISGLRFRGVETYGNRDTDYGVWLVDATDFRVDHCAFSLLGFAGVRTEGACRGVVDHCRFSEHYKPALGSHGYGVVVYGTGAHTGAPFGSPEATFVEDCEVRLCRHAVTANKGARYVFRHNLVRRNTHANAIDALGQEYSSKDSVGTEWIEVYGNVVERPHLEDGDSPLKYAVRIRGGGGLVFENTFADAEEGVRVDEFTPQDTGPVYVWGNELQRDPRSGQRPGYCAETEDSSGVLCPRVATADAVRPPADGVPVVFEAAPEGYAAAPYPHPLVSAQRLDAGRDRTAVLRAGDKAVRVPLVGSSSASPGAEVLRERWFMDGLELESVPPEGVPMPRGRHLVLRVTEHAGGRTAADATVVDVVPTFQPLASAERDWLARWFEPLGGRGEARFRVTPGKDRMDGYATLAGDVEVAAHGDNVMLVRASEAGVFDARNGDEYAADAALPYTAGTTYEVRITFDCAAGTYSVWIDGAALATGYHFRVPAERLSQVTVWHGHGGLTLTDFAIEGAAGVP